MRSPMPGRAADCQAASLVLLRSAAATRGGCERAQPCSLCPQLKRVGIDAPKGAHSLVAAAGGGGNARRLQARPVLPPAQGDSWKTSVMK